MTQLGPFLLCSMNKLYQHLSKSAHLSWIFSIFISIENLWGLECSWLGPIVQMFLCMSYYQLHMKYKFLNFEGYLQVEIWNLNWMQDQNDLIVIHRLVLFLVGCVRICIYPYNISKIFPLYKSHLSNMIILNLCNC